MSTAQPLDTNLALDPRRSVVVEACAGSGKTWLLVSRLVRLLLDGVKPGQILAITFTRKAAAEIEVRLRDALALLARGDDEAVFDYLVQRGLPAGQAREALPRARGLYELYLQADPSLTVGTFHSWFARLLSAAPLDSPLSGRQLDESTVTIFDEAWAGLSADCTRDEQGAVAQALLQLFTELGAMNTRRLVRRFLARSAEWQMWVAEAGSLDAVLQALPGLLEAPEGAPHEALTSADMRALLNRLLRGLEAGSATTIQCAARLREALAMSDGEAAAPLIADVLLTQKSEPRKLVAAGTRKVLGAEDLARFEADLAAAQGTAQAYREALVIERNVRINQCALQVGVAVLERMESLKRARRMMDFNDLEIEVDRLLRDPATGAAVQARLDARYRHILLDEFQDTNPMQWRVLRAWLDAYEGTGTPPPVVFMVGDPKQSIYRFRRAEPRLFDVAREYFADTHAAHVLETNHTRRNAGAVVDAVNAVFAGEMPYEGFRAQTTQRIDWPGRVEILPLVQAVAGEALPGDDEVDGRDPLTEPVQIEEDLRRVEEAQLLAERLQQMRGRTQVREADGSERPMEYGDVLILTRSTTQLAPYEEALREAGIPFVSPGRGGLLDTMEAQDLLALLRFLTDPADALSLARVLRTPVFDLDEAQLLEIFRRESNAPAGIRSGWGLLAERAARGEAPWVAIHAAIDGWIERARHLPAHDLLDFIFHDTDWLACYRRRVPESMWPSVLANFDAFIALTLSVDAGRYPSLSRLVDALRNLSDGGDEDAPDEGLIAVDASTLGRVRIMTIHGAKGLEAPVVWLINAHGKKRGLDGYDMLIDWPPEAEGPRHFSVVAKHSERGKARDALAEVELAAQAREQLNLLYVAMTRAQQVFIASGIALKNGENPESHHALLSAAIPEGVCGGEMMEIVPEAAPQTPLGDPPAGLHTSPATGAQGGALQNPASPLGGRGTKDISLPLAEEGGAVRRGRDAAAVLQIGERLTLSPMSIGQQFGIGLHAWLEHRTAGLPEPDVPADVRKAGERILARPALAALFDPARILRGGNEVAYVDTTGRTGRMDRWVETEDAVWVLDYKSGSAADAPLAQYRAQLEAYRAALRHFVGDKPVRGLLIFTDGTDLEL